MAHSVAHQAQSASATDGYKHVVHSPEARFERARPATGRLVGLSLPTAARSL